jgi:hypothetical protein
VCNSIGRDPSSPIPAIPARIIATILDIRMNRKVVSGDIKTSFYKYTAKCS